MKHPLHGDKEYPTSTVLRDLASQEGCDGDPYDQMVEAADEIDSLELTIPIGTTKMTPEQKAAYINAQAVCTQAEIAGMVAENMQREHLGQSMAYDDKAFLDVVDKYCVSHNAVLTLFQQP